MSIKILKDPRYEEINKESGEFIVLPTNDIYKGEELSEQERTRFLEESYVGAVLYKGEHNGNSDSDFYAIVWEDDKLRKIEYGTTRSWTYYNRATIDASPEVIAEAEKWLTDWYIQHFTNQATQDVANPTKGKTVRVTKGRKYKGQEGTIMWRGANAYRTYYRNGYNQPEDPYNQRLGLKIEGFAKLVYVPLLNVEVINAPKLDTVMIANDAKRAASQHSWHTPFFVYC